MRCYRCWCVLLAAKCFQTAVDHNAPASQDKKHYLHTKSKLSADYPHCNKVSWGSLFWAVLFHRAPNRSLFDHLKYHTIHSHNRSYSARNAYPEARTKFVDHVKLVSGAVILQPKIQTREISTLAAHRIWQSWSLPTERVSVDNTSLQGPLGEEDI